VKVRIAGLTGTQGCSLDFFQNLKWSERGHCAPSKGSIDNDTAQNERFMILFNTNNYQTPTLHLIMQPANAHRPDNMPCFPVRRSHQVLGDFWMLFPLISLTFTVFYMLDSPVSGPGQMVSAPVVGKIWTWVGYLSESCVTNML
jgi:hypothetical protein